MSVSVISLMFCYQCERANSDTDPSSHTGAVCQCWCVSILKTIDQATSEQCYRLTALLVLCVRLELGVIVIGMLGVEIVDQEFCIQFPVV